MSRPSYKCPWCGHQGSVIDPDWKPTEGIDPQAVELWCRRPGCQKLHYAVQSEDGKTLLRQFKMLPLTVRQQAP